MNSTRSTVTGYWRKALILLLLLSAPQLCACVGNSGPSKPIYYYTLTHPEADVRFDVALPSTLRVERFAVSPPFDSQRIYYADSTSHRNAYAYHQWVVPPGELLPYLFARDLRQSQGFRAVLTPGAALTATHSLHGWVEEFIEKDNPRQWQAAVTIHLTLISNADPDPVAKVLLQKKYQAMAPCTEKTPAALAEAMSMAVGQVMSAAVRDIYSRLSAAPTLKY